MLNAAKFKVIQQIEENLPVSPFKDEWDELKRNKRYKDGKKLETILPIMFMVLYAIAIIAILVSKGNY